MLSFGSRACQVKEHEAYYKKCMKIIHNSLSVNLCPSSCLYRWYNCTSHSCSSILNCNQRHEGVDCREAIVCGFCEQFTLKLGFGILIDTTFCVAIMTICPSIVPTRNNYVFLRKLIVSSEGPESSSWYLIFLSDSNLNTVQRYHRGSVWEDAREIINYYSSNILVYFDPYRYTAELKFAIHIFCYFSINKALSLNFHI